MRPGHGASRGIGRSTVLALARAGYDVAVNYSSSQAAEAVGAAAEGLGAGSCCAGPTSLTRTRSSPWPSGSGGVRPARCPGQQRRNRL